MKKVLIVTYYWPPAGGPGVQRWLKFVKYLPEFGIQPVVYIPKNPHYPLRDESLMREVPRDLELLQKEIFEPYAAASLISNRNTQKISSGIIPEAKKQGMLQKFMLFVRGNFFIPDARKFWIKPSVSYLSSYLQENNIDTLITTGPPHSIHLIGLQLKKLHKISWLADFRDPWTRIGYHEELKLLPFARKKHEKLEKQVLDRADQIITTSFLTKEEFQEKTQTPIQVITNGYDHEKIDPLPPDPFFSLSHIGSLLSGRNPEQLWRAIEELIKEDASFSKDFKLRLVGAVGEPVLESIRKAGLEEHLILSGYVSHQKALQLQRSSQLLLLIEMNKEETRGIIPGKLFEYMASNRPILALGPENADVERIIKKTNTGTYFLYFQKEEIKDFLREQHAAYKQAGLSSHPIGLQQYSRRALTAELADLIKKNR